MASLKDGQSIQFARDHEAPGQSINTRLIAGALASGGVFATEKPFLDTLEEVPGGKPKRTVTWCMDGGKQIEFAPIESGESIDFAEFKRRFLSLQWCEQNPNHPIAYMRCMSEMLNRLRDKLHTMKPMVLIRRGNRTALIPADCDAAKRAAILALL